MNRDEAESIARELVNILVELRLRNPQIYEYITSYLDLSDEAIDEAHDILFYKE